MAASPAITTGDVTSPPAPPREDKARRRGGGAVALARSRLRRTFAARFATACAILVTVGLAAAALALRASDGGDASLEGLLAAAARTLTWLVAAPLALAAAQDRRALDRREGVDALAAARGISPASLASARVLAAMLEITRALALPLGALALLIIALSGSARLALARLALGLGVLLFALVTAVTLGGLGAAAGRIGRERGRWLLFAVIAGPWILADLAGHGAWSIPGALDAALDFVLHLGHVGPFGSRA